MIVTHTGSVPNVTFKVSLINLPAQSTTLQVEPSSNTLLNRATGVAGTVTIAASRVCSRQRPT